jgi:hypothetical protein
VPALAKAAKYKKRSSAVLLAAASLFCLAWQECFAQRNPQNQAPLTLDQVRAMGKDQIRQRMESVVPGMQVVDRIPTNFPITSYPSNVTKTGFITDTKGALSAVATIFTRDEPSVVYHWYEDTCRKDSWIVQEPSADAKAKMGKDGSILILLAQKAKERVTIVCAENRHATGTKASISWSKQPN